MDRCDTFAVGMLSTAQTPSLKKLVQVSSQYFQLTGELVLGKETMYAGNDHRQTTRC